MRERDLLVHAVVLREEDAHFRQRRGGRRGRRCRDGRLGKNILRLRVPDDIDEAIEEARTLHRFDQIRVDPHRLEFDRTHRLAERGQDDQPRGCDSRIGLDRPRQRQPVHLRHLHVEQREVVGRALRRGRAQQLQRLMAASGAALLHFPGENLVAQDLPIRRVVVDHQHPQVKQIPAEFRRRFRFAQLFLKLRGEPERRALAQFALEVDFALHHRHELLGNREAEPGAAIFPRRRAVRLREGLEQAVLHFRWDANARIDDVEAQHGVRRRLALFEDAHHHLAALGELDGVADEVEENLAQAARIAAQAAGHVRQDGARELDALALRPLRQHVERPLDCLHQIKVERLEGELAGLDLGEIQNVVDDRQQIVRAVEHGLGELALLRLQRCVEEQAGHADDGVHRRANLVAHVGEELALRVRRMLGVGLRDFQRRLRLFALDRGGDVLRHELQQVAVLVAVTIHAGVMLHREHSERAPLRAERDAEPVDRQRADLLDLPAFDHRVEHFVREQQRFSGPHHRGRETVAERPRRRHLVDLVDKIRETQHVRLLVVEGNVEIFHGQQFADDPVDQQKQRGQVLRGMGRLRDFQQRRLHELGPLALRHVEKHSLQAGANPSRVVDRHLDDLAIPVPPRPRVVHLRGLHHLSIRHDAPVFLVDFLDHLRRQVADHRLPEDAFQRPPDATAQKAVGKSEAAFAIEPENTDRQIVHQ